MIVALVFAFVADAEAVVTNAIVAPDYWVVFAGVVLPFISGLAFKPEVGNFPRTMLALVLAGGIAGLQVITDTGSGDLALAGSAFGTAVLAQLATYKTLHDGMGVDINELAPNVGLSATRTIEDY